MDLTEVKKMKNKWRVARGELRVAGNAKTQQII
jgi:hypothetical protein